ncbi:Hpt domain-containing protein [Pyxidicoccus sp. 3LFB2]
MNPSDRLLKQFRDLVTVRLERINRSLMELEAGASAEAGRGVLRELHGLKGEARMMGFDDINVLVHEMEELVRCTESHRYSLSAPSADALLLAADAVLLLSGALPSSEAPPQVDKLVGSLRACIRAEADRIALLVCRSPRPCRRRPPRTRAERLDGKGRARRRGVSPRSEPRQQCPPGAGRWGFRSPRP